MAFTIKQFGKFIDDLIKNEDPAADEAVTQEMAAFLKENESDRLKEVIENNVSCSVCLDIPTETVRTKCGHVFCKFCLQKCQLDNAKCPQCRFFLKEFLPQPLVQIDEVIVKVMSDNDPEYPAARCRTILERNCTMLEQWQDKLSFFDRNVKRQLKSLVTKYKDVLSRYPIGENPTAEMGMEKEKKVLDEMFATLAEDIRPIWLSYLVYEYIL